MCFGSVFVWFRPLFLVQLYYLGCVSVLVSGVGVGSLCVLGLCGVSCPCWVVWPSFVPFLLESSDFLFLQFFQYIIPGLDTAFL